MGVNKLLLRSSKDKPGITALTRYSKWIINALITSESKKYNNDLQNSK